MKKLAALFIVIVLFEPGVLRSQNHDSLEKQFAQIASSLKANVGVAVIDLDNRSEAVSFNGTLRFPMQSVYKFHLGLAILRQVDEGKLSLDQKIRIDKNDYFPTWSPLMKKYPEGNVEISLGEVLMLTASQSDNIGCDVLFNLIGGPSEVEKYIKSIGIKEISIANTEREMHNDPNLQFKNSTTPITMVQLVEQFYRQNIISKSGFDFMWKAMVETPMGRQRIKGMLPEGTIVAHRTGTGGPNKEGVQGAVNDVGIIKLANGKTIALAVFISNAQEEQAKAEEGIAKISKAVYDYYNLR